MTVPGSHGSVSYHLLAVLLKLAPNASAQALMSAKFNEMVGLPMNEEEMISELTIILHDGFCDDEWPWGSGYAPQV